MLNGKIAVVTRSTQGLGEVVACLSAERGAAGIVLCGHNQARGEAVAASLGGWPASRRTGDADEDVAFALITDRIRVNGPVAPAARLADG